jgi:hypothetical protein
MSLCVIFTPPELAMLDNMHSMLIKVKFHYVWKIQNLLQRTIGLESGGMIPAEKSG